MNWVRYSRPTLCLTWLSIICLVGGSVSSHLLLHVLHVDAMSLWALHAQHPLKCPLEIGIAQRIQNGVERRVEITEPYGGSEYGLIDAVLTSVAIMTVGHHHEQGKVWQPAEDKCTNNDP